jgi:SAM-dependent methyltransferase
VTAAELVQDLVVRDALTGATLSKPRRRATPGYSRATVRPIDARGCRAYAWTTHFPTRTESENLSPAATAERLGELLGEFRQALLHAADADYQVLGGTRVLERPPTRPAADLTHDRTKRRILPEGVSVPFLVELGVMTPDGKVRAARRDKFRQVNRFLELVEDVLPALPAEGTLRVVDFGSGKSYLTFALHHLLREVHGREVEIVGLDLKGDVVEHCSALAERLGADGLGFAVADIAEFEPRERPHLVVSLHACDTATDEALAQAVRWDAPVILAVPCCQHELARQLDSSALRPLLAHGLLRDRFAADVTDAARASLLRLAGYDVQLVELVAVEHTPKNVLIRAVRNLRRDRRRAAEEYLAFKRELGIDPYLERALADRIELAA